MKKLDDKSIKYKKLKEIDEFLFESYKKVNIYKYLTPTNLIEENNKFIERFKLGIEYNPVYKYETNAKDYDSKIMLNKIQKYKNELSQINLDGYKMYKTILKREKYMLDDLENMINLSNNIGDSDSNIDFYSKKIYGEPNIELIKNAKSILEEDLSNIDTMNCTANYTANDCKELFEKILIKLKLNWNVKINNVQSSKICVIPEEKIIKINAIIKFSKNDLKRLAVHEIGTHVIRAENGSKQPYKIFSMEIGNVLCTEEGLATVNEEDCGVLDKRTLKIYAGRVLAISECRKKSFYEVFKLMLKYFCSQDALYIVSRVKRGIKYTKNHEVFVKDYVYLDGYYKVKKYLECHEKKDLYNGIIGINEVEGVNNLIENGILNKTGYFDLSQYLKEKILEDK